MKSYTTFSFFFKCLGFHSWVLQIFSLYHWASKGNLFAKRGYPLSPNWKTIKNEFKGLKIFINASLLVYFSVFQLCSLLSLCLFSSRFALFDQKIDNNSISENISTFFYKKTWHIITFILTKTFTRFLFVQCINFLCFWFSNILVTP
jgi:hypothetical protein